jgi:hypothetical protein
VTDFHRLGTSEYTESKIGDSATRKVPDWHEKDSDIPELLIQRNLDAVRYLLYLPRVSISLIINDDSDVLYLGKPPIAPCEKAQI